MNLYKKSISERTNLGLIVGDLKDVIIGSDIFIGVSGKNTFQGSYIKLMNDQPVIMALANPNPEIMYDVAKENGAFIVCTGRSDYPNQVNNSLVFPGLFRAVVETQSKQINNEMKFAAVYALVNYVTDLSPSYVIPNCLDTEVHLVVAREVAKAAITSKQAQIKIKYEEVENNMRDFIFDRNYKIAPKF